MGGLRRGFGRKLLTFPLQEKPEQRAGGGDGLVVIVIVVDGQQVAVDVGVAHQQLHVGDAVDVLQEPVELIEAARLRPIQREPAKLCAKLRHTQGRGIANEQARVKVREQEDAGVCFGVAGCIRDQ